MAPLLTRSTDLARRLACSDLDFDTHARVCQSGTEHRCRWTYIAEMLPQNRPASRKIGRVREDVEHANDVLETAACLVQSGRDIPQALFRLLDHAVRNRHGGVVES